MGKERTRKKGKRQTLEHQIRSQYEVDPELEEKKRRRRRGGRSEEEANNGEEDDNAEEFVDTTLSTKILMQAREQQDEIEREDAGETEHTAASSVDRSSGVVHLRYDTSKDNGSSSSSSSSSSSGNGGGRRDSDSEEEEEEEYVVDLDSDDDEDDGEYGFNVKDEQEYKALMSSLDEMDNEDARAVQMFLRAKNGGQAKKPRMLADIVMARLAEQQESEGQSRKKESPLEGRAREVYRKVGTLLKRYKSGKLPKAFMVIPMLETWEEMLYLTNPHEWSAQAMYKAVRIFVSNMKPEMLQRFLNLVLLPRVQQDIEENQKLNFHMYLALKKALFKAEPFIKGFLLPLCESMSCTLREARIIGSVLQKLSVPRIHASAAITLIADLDYSPANSMFIGILLDKGYNLPYQTIDALVAHFQRFAGVDFTMPVVWFSCFLIFAQSYKKEITLEQREQLKYVLRRQHHHFFTDEIRRELFSVHLEAE